MILTRGIGIGGPIVTAGLGLGFGVGAGAIDVPQPNFAPPKIRRIRPLEPIAARGAVEAGAAMVMGRAGVRVWSELEQRNSEALLLCSIT